MNEIQTITQIFYPNARFQFPDTHSATAGVSVVSRLCSDAMCCVGEVYLDGALRHTHSLIAPSQQTVRRTLMLALYYALKQTIQVNTPWGALTGIRPSKLVREWLSEAMPAHQILETLQSLYDCRPDKARLALAVAYAEQRVSAAFDIDKPHTAGLYIGIPFCPSRCLYCSFTASSARVTETILDDYLRALAHECENFSTSVNQKQITSVYIGGGTPTVLDERRLDTLLAMVDRYFAPSERGIEFTVEAGRPDSVTHGKLRVMKAFGVNRISINPQTIHDDTLKRIGRAHTSADFFRAFDRARAHGFAHINTDIIVGLPEENRSHVAQTMAALAALAPESVTVHTLAVKRGSRLNEYLAMYPLAGADETEAMLDTARLACEARGLRPYYLYRQKNMVGNFENVGYSLPGCECLYNVGMMADLQTVYGLGAGAVTKRAEGSRIDRSFNVKNPDIYIQRQINSC